MCDSRKYLKSCLIKSSEARWRQPDALNALGEYGESIGRSRKHFNPGLKRLLDIQNAKEILNLGTPVNKRLPGLMKALNNLPWTPATETVPGWGRNLDEVNYHLGLARRPRSIYPGTPETPYLYRNSSLPNPFINQTGLSRAAYASAYPENSLGYGLNPATRTSVLNVFKPKPGQIHTSDFGIEKNMPGLTAKQFRSSLPAPKGWQPPREMYETLVTSGDKSNKHVGRFLTRGGVPQTLKVAPMDKRTTHIANQIARSSRKVIPGSPGLRPRNPVMIGTPNSKLTLPSVRDIGGNVVRAIRKATPHVARIANSKTTRKAGPIGAGLGAGALGWLALKKYLDRRKR